MASVANEKITVNPPVGFESEVRVYQTTATAFECPVMCIARVSENSHSSSWFVDTVLYSQNNGFCPNGQGIANPINGVNNVPNNCPAGAGPFKLCIIGKNRYTAAECIMPCGKCELIDDPPETVVGQTKDLGTQANENNLIEPGCLLIPGDVNGDDKADVIDLVIIANFVVGFNELPEGAFCAADINSNDTVDITVSDKSAVYTYTDGESSSIVELFHCLGMLNSPLALCNTGHCCHHYSHCARLSAPL